MPKFDDDTENEDSDIYLWLDYQDGEISEDEFQRRMYGDNDPTDYTTEDYEKFDTVGCVSDDVHSMYANKYQEYIKSILSHLDKEVRKSAPLYFDKINKADCAPVFFDDESIQKGINDGLELVYSSLCDYILQHRIKNKIHSLPALPKDYEYAFDYNAYDEACIGTPPKIENFIRKQKIHPKGDLYYLFHSPRYEGIPEYADENENPEDLLPF